jgi:hypothetical protein
MQRDQLLNQLSPRMSLQQLSQIARFVGECMAARDPSGETLHQYHQRLHKVLTQLDDESVLRGAINVLVAALTGFFAALEPAQQLENLGHQVNQTPELRRLLIILSVAEDELLSTICERLRAHTSTQKPDASSEKENHASAQPLYETLVTIGLDKLQELRLVECVPNNKYRLTELGRNLCRLLNIC